MFIKELKITNFKSFNGDINSIQFSIPNGNPGSGLNVFVGENNTGKSTVFEAIDFVRNGTKKSIDDIRNKHNPIDPQVDIIFSGDIAKTIEAFSQDNKKAVFNKHVYTENGESFLRISRNASDLKQLRMWSAVNNAYVNESGIDAPLRKLFETNFVWADTNPNDEAAFGSTTICGNLLKEIANNFIGTPDYQDFRNKFNEIFNTQNSGLKRVLEDIEQRAEQIFTEQFGAARIRFYFDELKIDSFFKNTTIKIDDGIETPMHEKGNGMQRAIALALLQVYADELITHPENDNLKKPFYLFIDEPEICLHPKGQEQLFNALLEISQTQQVFLTTHSPYFLATKSLKNIGLFIFSKNGNTSVIEPSSVNPLLPWSPTWGEINFKAYKLPTVEFHNELYGYLQYKYLATTENAFEAQLGANGVSKTKQWTKEIKGAPQAPYDVSLQTFIRNKIHHPENTTMAAVNFTNDELAQSINEMIALI